MAGNPAVARRMEAAATLMRRRGLTVGAFAGWRDAGRSSTMNPRAVTAHHTAAAIDVDRILRDGRADLPGPLCNWALHLDGSWWLVASGRANHAGEGVLPSSESYGIECTGPVPAGNTGIDAFPMYRSYALGVACICEAEGWTARVVYGHKETARPDCRKPDPAFGDGCPTPYLDMDRFRASVQARIGVDTPEEDELSAADVEALKKHIDAQTDEVTRRVVYALLTGDLRPWNNPADPDATSEAKNNWTWYPEARKAALDEILRRLPAS
jgi:hypothetical protein